MLSNKKHKQKLILLITLVMMSLNVFSQNDIKPTALADSTTIQLTKPIAKLVIKDLIKFDGLSQEMLTMQSILTETNNKLIAQSDLVTNLKTQINNYQSIIDKKDEQLGVSSELSKELEKQLKKETRTKKLYKTTSTIGAAAILILLLK